MFLLSKLKLPWCLASLLTELVHRSVDSITNALLGTQGQTMLPSNLSRKSLSLQLFLGSYFQVTHSKNLNRLTELGRRGKEKAAFAISYFRIVFPSSSKPITDKLLQALFASHKNGQIEVNFSTSKVIACLATEHQSKSASRKIDLT